MGHVVLNKQRRRRRRRQKQRRKFNEVGAVDTASRHVAAVTTAEGRKRPRRGGGVGLGGGGGGREVSGQAPVPRRCINADLQNTERQHWRRGEIKGRTSIYRSRLRFPRRRRERKQSVTWRQAAAAGRGVFFLFKEKKNNKTRERRCKLITETSLKNQRVGRKKKK